MDREFGTGALKVTPAHDPVDYELGKRHNLPLISILNKDATISAAGGQYAGLDRFACREQIWKDMLEVRLLPSLIPEHQLHVFLRSVAWEWSVALT